MKRISRIFSALDPKQHCDVSFTVDEVLTLLSAIEELENTTISLDISPGGSPQFVVGNNIYTIYDKAK